MTELFSKYSYFSVWSETMAWSLCLILLVSNIRLYLTLKKWRHNPHGAAQTHESTQSFAICPPTIEASTPTVVTEKNPPATTIAEPASNNGSELPDLIPPLASQPSSVRSKSEVIKEDTTALEGGNASLRTIRTFLSLSEVYRGYYDDIIKVARRKLAAGQAEELMTSLKSDSTVKQPKADFLKKFDEAVELVIPNFTARVNSLLAPDRQLTEGTNLDAETRIAAMMCLGETDSQLIADILGLSLNTVYSYRNRLKSRAKNRDEFEAQIRSLAATSSR